MIKIVTVAEMRQQLPIGAEPMVQASAEVFSGFFQWELARWGKVSKAAGIKAE